MQINIAYDQSVSGAPAGFKTAVNAAVQYFDALIADPTVVTINFGWGEERGTAISGNSIGASNSSGYTFTGAGYTQVINALAAHATSAADLSSVHSLPTTDPTGHGLFLTQAQALTLGLTSNPATGYVGLNANVAYTFDPANRAVSNTFDAIGVLQHEISEVLGRRGFLGMGFGANVTGPDSVLDLFRYSAKGVLDAVGAGYFSVDGGATQLMTFNDPRQGGDAADWLPTLRGDAFGDVNKGLLSAITEPDLTSLDVIGYTLKGAPAFGFAGSASRDSFYSTTANDSFSGNGGLDRAVYSGNHTQYQIVQSGSSVNVSDLVSGRDGQDTLQNVSRIVFKDEIIALDTTGNAGEAYRLYNAAFARTPDRDGVSFWTEQVDNGMSLHDVASSFIGSAEFKGIYGANPTVSNLVSGFYTNVLGRAPDSTGLNFWVGQVRSGMSTADLLVSFSESAENKAHVAPAIQHGIELSLSFFA